MWNLVAIPDLHDQLSLLNLDIIFPSIQVLKMGRLDIYHCNSCQHSYLARDYRYLRYTVQHESNKVLLLRTESEFYIKLGCTSTTWLIGLNSSREIEQRSGNFAKRLIRTNTFGLLKRCLLQSALVSKNWQSGDSSMSHCCNDEVIHGF